MPAREYRTPGSHVGHVCSSEQEAGRIVENWPRATPLIHRGGMYPEHCDDLLGDVWDCDLEQDAARDADKGMQDLLEDLVFDLVEAP